MLTKTAFICSKYNENGNIVNILTKKKQFCHLLSIYVLQRTKCPSVTLTCYMFDICHISIKWPTLESYCKLAVAFAESYLRREVWTFIDV